MKLDAINLTRGVARDPADETLWKVLPDFALEVRVVTLTRKDFLALVPVSTNNKTFDGTLWDTEFPPWVTGWQKHPLSDNPRTIFRNATLGLAETITSKYRPEFTVRKMEAQLFLMWFVKRKAKLLGGVYYLAFKFNLPGKNPMLVDVRRRRLDNGKGFLC